MLAERGRARRYSLNEARGVSFRSYSERASNRSALARIEVFGLLHAVLERKAGKSLFRRVAAEPCPLFFGDPESGFYPRFPVRRPREEVFRFLVEALRFHHLILAQGA